MPADLEELLRTPEPSASPPDVDALWQAGRRRRRRRLVAATGAGFGGSVAVIVGAVVLVGGQQAAVPEIEPLAPPAEVTTEEPAATGSEAAEATGDVDGASGEAAGTDLADVPELDDGWALSADEARLIAQVQRRAVERAAEERAAEERQAAADDTAAAAGTRDPGPTSPSDATSGSEPIPSPTPTPSTPASPVPDPGRVAAPCAAHAGAAPSAFIDVVSPVAGQAVGTSFELVGCASVYEGTVRYRVLDAADRTIVDRFTTATAGGPELGEFRRTVTVDADGPLTLHVFWDSPADGEGERDLQVVRLERR